MSRTVEKSIIKNTESDSTKWVFEGSTEQPDFLSLPPIKELAQRSLSNLKVVSILETFNEWNEATGGHVRLLPELQFCPVLIGDDGNPIPLYELVEVIDGVVDYSEIQAEFPNISFAQIDGAISFLRKIAQFNILGVDFDDLEDEMLAEDEGLLEELRNALANQEIPRVLDFGE